MVENLDAFLEDFGVTALSSGNSFIVIFDEDHSPMELGVEGRRVMATCKTSDTVNFSHEDVLTIASKDYEIVGIRPIMDGKFTELDLKYV